MKAQGVVGGIKLHIRHTMLPVSDLERTIDFYTRLLGMDVMRLREPPGERVAYLGYGCEDEEPALELIQTGKAGEVAKVPPWAGHVALYVSDLYKLCDMLKKEGVVFTCEPRPNRPGAKDHVAFIKDPDGYTLELTERHSVTGPPLKRK